eukprot:1367468-Pyramimonas_sp.AAC.1
MEEGAGRSAPRLGACFPRPWRGRGPGAVGGGRRAEERRSPAGLLRAWDTAQAERAQGHPPRRDPPQR